MSGASAEEFKKWREHAARVSMDSLKYIIKDCVAARESFKGWNSERENHYADQCFTYSDELYRRNKLLKKLQSCVYSNEVPARVNCCADLDGSIIV